MQRPRVLVVGAGPVGMVLAAELLRHGVRADVISKLRRQSPHSRATILWPRILELLDRVGVGRKLVEGGHYFDQMNYYSNKKMIGLVRFDRLRGVGYPFAITIPQWRTHGLIVASRHPLYGPDGTIEVLVQCDPEDEADVCWYHLAPGEYTLED